VRCDAYITLRANLRAGNLGKPGSKRRRKAESKPVVFRPEAAHPFDDRCLSWQYDAQTVSKQYQPDGFIGVEGRRRRHVRSGPIRPCGSPAKF
jgi:hypothetical protein